MPNCIIVMPTHHALIICTVDLRISASQIGLFQSISNCLFCFQKESGKHYMALVEIIENMQVLVSKFLYSRSIVSCLNLSLFFVKIPILVCLVRMERTGLS